LFFDLLLEKTIFFIKVVFFFIRDFRADGYTRLFWEQEVRRFDSCNPDNIALWCNGNTTVFGAVISGSSPDKATFFILKNIIFASIVVYTPLGLKRSAPDKLFSFG
jgi:hypothetical protein